MSSERIATFSMRFLVQWSASEKQGDGRDSGFVFEDRQEHDHVFVFHFPARSRSASSTPAFKDAHESLEQLKRLKAIPRSDVGRDRAARNIAGATKEDVFRDSRRARERARNARLNANKAN